MEPVYRCVAGIDVHKKMLAVIVRRDQDGQPQYEKRKFGTTRKEILALAAWLQHWQVSEVVIAYASHCTSVGWCDTFSTGASLFDNLMPLAFRGGSGPGSS